MNIDALNAFLEDLLGQSLEHSALGVVLGYSSPKLGSHLVSAGTADLESRVTIEPGHLFQIGSVTKTFTGACVHKLVQQGSISLDTPIVEILDDFPGDPGIVVRQLLNHTSGMGNASRLLDPINHVVDFPLSHAERMLLARVARSDFRPGAGWEYNNAGYWALGEMVGVVSGMPFGRFLEQQIFEPLGLGNSYVGSDYAFPVNRMARAVHTDAAGETIETTSHLSLAESGAAGDVVSNVGDVLKWLQALQDPNNACGVSFQDLKQGETSCRSDGYSNALGYASGLQHLLVGGREYWGHGGAMCGYLSMAMFDPVSELSIAVLSTRHTRAGPRWLALQSVSFSLVESIATVLHSQDVL